MRIKDLITQDKSNWYFNKFSPLLLLKKIGTTNDNLNFDIRVQRVNVQSDKSLFITETGLIVGKLIKSEVGMGTNLGIWSKHIHLACRVLYFGVLQKPRLYSQGEGCPITTKLIDFHRVKQIWSFTVVDPGEGTGALGSPHILDQTRPEEPQFFFLKSLNWPAGPWPDRSFWKWNRPFPRVFDEKRFP